MPSQPHARKSREIPAYSHGRKVNVLLGLYMTVQCPAVALSRSLSSDLRRFSASFTSLIKSGGPRNTQLLTLVVRNPWSRHSTFNVTRTIGSDTIRTKYLTIRNPASLRGIDHWN